MIERDILQRCRDTLRQRRVPEEGLSVDGRDVILSGREGSPITSEETRLALQRVSGVREVRVVADARQNGDSSVGGDGETSPAQRELQDKLDRLLENQEISFKPDSTALTPESEAVLTKIAGALAGAPGLRCEIRAYDKHPKNNEAASRQDWVIALQRALATEDYLIAQGIPEWRLATRAFRSDAGPASEGRRRDRVIDFIVRSR